MVRAMVATLALVAAGAAQAAVPVALSGPAACTSGRAADAAPLLGGWHTEQLDARASDAVASELAPLWRGVRSALGAEAAPLRVLVRRHQVVAGLNEELEVELGGGQFLVKFFRHLPPCTDADELCIDHAALHACADAPQQGAGEDPTLFMP
mmetsp:Transcript_8903/g.22638  ORF Transcript_8903/g.22638 Transcript_8903/m.22638 type:complete len:152 (-) Transcript_8903:171-626(-)